MNDLTIFSNSEFGEVRVITVNEEPWFVGNDVAIALGYKDTSDALKRHIDPDDKLTSRFTDSGQSREMYIINESGLYSLIFGSKLDSAKRFKKWVTSEVLPSIRKNGGYINQQESSTPEQIIANALIVAHKIIDNKDRQIEEMKPKAGYFDALVDSNLLTNFRDTAKELHMSQTQFTGWLLDKKYIYKDSKGTILPYEPYREKELFQIKDYRNPYNGFTGRRTYVTPKGKIAFKLLMESEGLIPEGMRKHGGRKAIVFS